MLYSKGLIFTVTDLKKEEMFNPFTAGVTDTVSVCPSSNVHLSETWKPRTALGYESVVLYGTRLGFHTPLTINAGTALCVLYRRFFFTEKYLSESVWQ